MAARCDRSGEPALAALNAAGFQVAHQEYEAEPGSRLCGSQGPAGSACGLGEVSWSSTRGPVAESNER